MLSFTEVTTVAAKAMTEKQQADKSEEKEATEGKSDKVNAVLNKRHSATKSVLVTIKKELLQIVNALKKRIVNLVSSKSVLVYGRKRGKLRKSWLSNIKEWTQMDLHSDLSSLLCPRSPTSEKFV